MWWEHLTTSDFAALDPQSAVVLLPVAAVEQHGSHLPLGTDALICDGIVDGALARLDAGATALRLPTQRVGLSPEHGAFPGTLTLSPETLIACWTQVGRSVARAGLRKLIIFNAHGGQPQIVDLVAQSLRRELGMLVVRASYYRFGLPEQPARCEGAAEHPEAIPPGTHAADPLAITQRERRYGIHGGQLETSLMLALAPALVRMERAHDVRSAAEDFDSRHAALSVEGDVGVGWAAEDLAPGGVVGNAGASTAALGHLLLDHYREKLARLITEVEQASWPPKSEWASSKRDRA